MDYNRFFSADVPSFLRSPVREIFRKVDLSAICSFAGGYPAADTFPVAEIPGLAASVLEKYGTKALQYGATQGVPELREAIAARYGVPVSQVQITTSSQQGIDVCTRVFVDPGDIILADDPVYLGALQSFRAYRATVKSCHSERAERVEESKVKFIYVIPDFNNPSGKTMTLEERKELVKVARTAVFRRTGGFHPRTGPGAHAAAGELLQDLCTGVPAGMDYRPGRTPGANLRLQAVPGPVPAGF